MALPENTADTCIRVFKEASSLSLLTVLDFFLLNTHSEILVTHRYMYCVLNSSLEYNAFTALSCH